MKSRTATGTSYKVGRWAHRPAAPSCFLYVTRSYLLRRRAVVPRYRASTLRLSAARPPRRRLGKPELEVPRPSFRLPLFYQALAKRPFWITSVLLVIRPLPRDRPATT